MGNHVTELIMIITQERHAKQMRKITDVKGNYTDNSPLPSKKKKRHRHPIYRLNHLLLTNLSPRDRGNQEKMESRREEGTEKKFKS